MGVGILVGESLDIFLHGRPTVENAGLDLGQVLAEAVVLVPYLVRQLTSVAHDENHAFSRNRIDLLQSSKHENRSLAKTGFCLADNIGSKDTLRNADLLNCEVIDVRL